MIEIPTDMVILESPIATYWIEDGILISKSKEELRTVENITLNMKLVKEFTGNKILPHISFICKTPIPDKATRNLSAKELPNHYKALAMVSDNNLGKIIMNIIFKMKAPSIPMRSFKNLEDAKKWVEKYN